MMPAAIAVLSVVIFGIGFGLTGVGSIFAVPLLAVAVFILGRAGV